MTTSGPNRTGDLESLSGLLEYEAPTIDDPRIIDLTAQADKSRRLFTRDPKRVWALVLHQMACCYNVKDPMTRFLKMAPHFAILPDGRILQLHPILSLTGASNGFNPGSVAVEFAGNFPDTRGKWWHGAENGQNQVTSAQIEAGRYLVRYLMRTMGLREILAHRQSSGTRDNDPGPDIWYHVGQWAIDNLGLKDGGPGFKVGTGNPIPDLWRTWGKVKPPPPGQIPATGPLPGQIVATGGSPLDSLAPAELKAVKITSTFETGRPGGFGGLTGNFDGQGLSFGLLNFTIKAGSLIPLLQEFITEHPARYANTFGSDAERFKEIVFATKPDPQNPRLRIRDVERQMEFVNNQMNSIPREAKGNKIVEPWKTYFDRLENDREFQIIQVKAVKNALKRARYWCDYFEFKTERGLAFMFDLVSSHGGAWLNAPKFHEKRRILLRAMFANKQAQVGRQTLTELEKMEVIANMIADVSSEKWRELVRTRKLWFVRGSGTVHGTFFDINKNFGVTDNPM